MAKTIDGLHFYDLQELAERLNVSKRTLLKYCRLGFLPYARIGSRFFVSNEGLKVFSQSRNGNLGDKISGIRFRITEPAVTP